MLVSAAIGIHGLHLPSWDAVHDALEEGEDLHQRVAQICELGFRGPLPKCALWVGSAWAKDDYPREPDFAPWGAFDYVDRETAKRLNERLERDDEAFKGNRLPFLDRPQEQSPVKASEGGAVVAPVVSHTEELNPQRADNLQLANRLFVDEALGLCTVVEDRVHLVAKTLFCPMLEEALKMLQIGSSSVDATKHHELLRYLAAQMRGPGARLALAREPYREEWQRVRSAAAKALSAPAPEELLALTSAADTERRGRSLREVPAGDEPMEQEAFLS
jgi:hypothetical protein